VLVSTNGKERVSGAFHVEFLPQSRDASQSIHSYLAISVAYMAAVMEIWRLPGILEVMQVLHRMVVSARYDVVSLNSSIFTVGIIDQDPN
jgi:hypothetical protein